MLNVEGPDEYMEDCVLQSYWLAYIRMAEPTLHQGTCAELGYDFVSTGTVFGRSKLYWKGGLKAYKWFTQIYLQAHPNIETMLAQTRDKNIACHHAASWSFLGRILIGAGVALLLLLLCLLFCSIHRRHRREIDDQALYFQLAETLRAQCASEYL